MHIYNSLSRKVEEIVPIHPHTVGMYVCGPTVYSFVTIGNWRTYFLGDLLYRTLSYEGMSVEYVMNITDVGHLTGDNLGDADTGEDRLEKAAGKEGKSAWDIATYYTNDFYEGYDQLHLTHPKVWCKATDHIPEQIGMVEAIYQKGMAYRITDGIYFDTKAFEAAGNTYGELSSLESIREGARVEVNPEKKDPRDFALWKFSPTGVKRQMEWESPWGMGFPGWHIECSAMSTKYLGNQFDIHAGGEDLRSTHHPNEIAQAEAATGKKPFVKYWIHGAFLMVDGGRMGKSLGNAYTLADVTTKGFDVLALRYFYMTGHYRKQLNFTWDGLKSASTALNSLRDYAYRLSREEERNTLTDEKLSKVDEYRQRFMMALGNDLNMPEALAVTWELLKSNIPARDRFDLLVEFDRVLGFGLSEWRPTQEVVPAHVVELAERRKEERARKDYAASDVSRSQMQTFGFDVEDTPTGYVIKKH